MLLLWASLIRMRVGKSIDRLTPYRSSIELGKLKIRLGTGRRMRHHGEAEERLLQIYRMHYLECR